MKLTVFGPEGQPVGEYEDTRRVLTAVVDDDGTLWVLPDGSWGSNRVIFGRKWSKWMDHSEVRAVFASFAWSRCERAE